MFVVILFIDNFVVSKLRIKNIDMISSIELWYYIICKTEQSMVRAWEDMGLLAAGQLKRFNAALSGFLRYLGWEGTIQRWEQWLVHNSSDNSRLKTKDG